MTGWRAKQLRQGSQHECGQSPAGPRTLRVCLEGIEGVGRAEHLYMRFPLLLLDKAAGL